MKTSLNYFICYNDGQFYCILLCWLSWKFPYAVPFFTSWKKILQCYLCLKDGRLQTGDHILQIGGTNVQGMTSEQVAQVLRNCGNSVRMIVARNPKCEIAESPPAPESWPVSALPSFQNGNVSIWCLLMMFLSMFVAWDQKGGEQRAFLTPKTLLLSFQLLYLYI